MSSRVELMSPLERQTYRQWLADATHERFGRCDSCGRIEHDDGGPLRVARQRGRRAHECLQCWEFGRA